LISSSWLPFWKKRLNEKRWGVRNDASWDLIFKRKARIKLVTRHGERIGMKATGRRCDEKLVYLVGVKV